jgi:hypothetical protein
MQVRRRSLGCHSGGGGESNPPDSRRLTGLKTAVGRRYMWRHPDAGPSGSLFVLGPEVAGAGDRARANVCHVGSSASCLGPSEACSRTEVSEGILTKRVRG